MPRPRRRDCAPRVRNRNAAVAAGTAHSAEGDAIAGEAGEHPSGDAQHQNAEEFLDRVHPCAGAGQQFSGGGADREQQHAHADRHREQRLPPRTMSPVWPITASAANNGGATQAETISADSAPITATPP
jgi:hypothetical protein